MEKWNKRAIIETTHFQLSDDDVGLLELEMAEIEAAKTATKKTQALNCRFNAIHAGTTKNLHTYLPEELSLSVDKWITPYEKPVLVNHDLTGTALGRIKEADFLKTSEVDGTLALRAAIVDEDAIQKIHDERYLTVSIGVASDRVECSICGANWLEDGCDHLLGEKYVLDDGMTEALCTAVIRDIRPLELSFVNVPANADEEKFAGLVSFGESEDFEFFSEAEGVGKRGRKKAAPKTQPDDALALKESFDEFLNKLNSEGESESENMDNLTKTDDNVEVEAALDTEEVVEDNSTTEDETSAQEQDNSQEENTAEQEAEENNDSSEDISEEVSDADALESILDSKETSSEETEATSDDVETSEDENESRLAELQNRVQELEGSNAELKAQLDFQTESAGKWFKAVRVLLGQHLADLKYALNKANDIESLETEESQKTIQNQMAEIKELRKEFKESDFSIAAVFSQEGILDNQTLTSDSDGVGMSSTKDEQKPALKESLEDIFVEGFSKHLSQSRPYKKDRS